MQSHFFAQDNHARGPVLPAVQLPLCSVFCFLENEGQAILCKSTVFMSTKKISGLQLLVQNEITCDCVANILKINRKVEDAQGWILIDYWTAVG